MAHRRARYILTNLLIVLGVMFAIVMLIGMFGGVTGVEFSPDQLERRSFVYYEIPVLHLQVFPVTRRDRTGPTELYLRSKGWTGKSTNDRWDLVRFERAGRHESFGEAKILCRYFDAVGDGKSDYWLDWSKSHPKLAKVVWPQALELARKQMYMLVPVVFDTVNRIEQPKPDELKQAIQIQLARRYVLLATAQRKQEKWELAKNLYTAAIELDATNVSAFKGRADVFRELGEGAAEKQDRDRADELASTPRATRERSTEGNESSKVDDDPPSDEASASEESDMPVEQDEQPSAKSDGGSATKT